MLAVADVGETELIEHVGPDAVGAERDRVREARRPGVADGVVHVRARVVHDRARESVVVGEVHAVHDEPVVAGQVADPIGRFAVVGSLGHVDVHTDTVLAWPTPQPPPTCRRCK